MEIRVDGGGLTTAASHLARRAEEVAEQAQRCGGVLPAGLTDRALRDAVMALADVAADVFELVGRDLDVLASTVRAGAMLYERVETGLAASAEPR